MIRLDKIIAVVVVATPMIADAQKLPRGSMDLKEAERIIQAYGEVQLEVANFLVASSNRLPYKKGEIKQAILLAMPKVANRMCENLRIGFMQLGMFQNVREMKMLDIPKNVMRLDDTGVDTWIQKNQFRADFIPLQKFVISEMERLLAEVPKC